MEAVFGLIGVVVGSAITWWQTVWSSGKSRDRDARYLAVRVVCTFDMYIESCAEVALDDGLSEGQRDEEGCLVPQVSIPAAPVFSDDLDWKSIDHQLMYKILALPSEATAANRLISAASDVAGPPDYEEAFEERQLQYARIGLTAYAITQELREEYGITPRVIGKWNPQVHLREIRERIELERSKRG